MKLTTLLLTLLAGLLLGWFAHEHWGAVMPKQAVSEYPVFTPAYESHPSPTQDSLSVSSQGNTVSAVSQRGTLAAAVERYEISQARGDADGMQQARDAVLLYAQQGVKAGDYVAVAQWLQRFLQASYRDVEARLLLADVFYGQQDYHGAIDQLYEAKAYAFRPEMLTHITRRIRNVVNEQANKYSEDQNNAGLLSLFQNVTQLEPDYAAYFIELAIVQLALEDRDAAQRSLVLVMNDADVGEQARAILATVQEAGVAIADSGELTLTTEVAGVPLIRSGQHYLVDVNPADAESLRLLIDTGASMTMLSRDALQRRGLRYRETGRSQLFSTANGQVRAPLYILESLSVGDWYVRQLEVGILDLGGQAGFDGLLGMNFLSHFRFFIDQNESVLRLSLN
jgi:clan AA aspartic protease (TIGR02281 family)